MSRINFNGSIIEAIVSMSEGNPGAISVMTQIMDNSHIIDPDAFGGGLTHILSLDSYEIYGPRIWMLYKDVCHENISHTIALIRAIQLGICDVETVNHAIDNYGEGIYMPHIISRVMSTLPNFKR